MDYEELEYLKRQIAEYVPRPARRRRSARAHQRGTVGGDGRGGADGEAGKDGQPVQDDWIYQWGPIAEALGGCATQTAMNYMQKYGLPVVKIGGQVAIRRKDLEEWKLNGGFQKRQFDRRKKVWRFKKIIPKKRPL